MRLTSIIFTGTHENYLHPNILESAKAVSWLGAETIKTTGKNLTKHSYLKYLVYKS